MTSVRNAQDLTSLFERTRAEQDSQNPNYDTIRTQLSQLKVGLIHLSMQDKQLELDSNFQLMKRSILELGGEFSIKTGDTTGFERYLTQLESLYFDNKFGLPESKAMYPLIGLNLLRMLSENQIADFHTMLERIDLEQIQNNPYIAHPVKLEQALMEGSYKKVWQARSEVPTPEYCFFVDMLMDTIRNEVASCTERSYTSLPLDDAKTVLFFSSLDELLSFAQEHNWNVNASDKRVYFPSQDENPHTFQGKNIMAQTLSYARELERIV